MDEDYRESAQAHSRDMAHKDYFAHEGPNGQQFKPNTCNRWGENIFRVRGRGADPETIADEAVTGWLDSPGHRRNLLDELFNAEGIGATIADDGFVYVTQTLCG